MGKYRSKKTAKDANNSRIYAKFGIEIYAAAKSGDPDPHANQNYVSSLIALKLIMYQNIIDRAIEKAKVQEMKHTLNCAMKDLDQAAQW